MVDEGIKSSNQNILKADSRSLTWYLICRTAVITFLLGGAAVFYLKGSLNHPTVEPLFFLIALSYTEALASAFFLKKAKKTDLFGQLQITWDILFVSVLILLTGGVESVFSFAYLLVIVSASFLLSRRSTVLYSAVSVVLFGAILDLQYFDYLEFIGLYHSVPDGTFFSTLFVHAVAFFLVAGLSGTLAERSRKSEEQLQKKKIDFEELEKLNRTILEHINSGLVLVDQEGNVRSFNRAASDITGLLLQDVYGCHLSEAFPELFDNISLGGEPVNRSECQFVKANGDRLILGYATMLAKGSKGEKIGTLITFQDLSQFKKIEDDLKRADRLAAVGRLAASMAHEIRNPLAAISGSVQLLIENSQATDDDQNLMNIVVNEADRLNELLTSFLHFARPKAPEKEPIKISKLIEQMIVLFDSDSRFQSVEINSQCSDSSIIMADSQQIQQIMWDLAINAVEAMQGSGTIAFTVIKNNPSTIIVEDSGPGISGNIKNRIFEPFFSTKDRGTGLGLSSVYSVIEAHAGKISVSHSSLGGARFSIEFPV